MNGRALALLPMVAFLAMIALADISSAQSNLIPPSYSPTVQGAVPTRSDAPGEFTWGWHNGPSLKRMMERLGITDQQKKAIHALYVAFKDRTRKARTELASLRDEKRTMLLSGKTDLQKLVQIDDQIVKLVRDIVPEKLELQRDRLALLTPEQRERIGDWQTEKAFRTKWKRMHYWKRMHRDDGWRGRFGE